MKVIIFRVCRKGNLSEHKNWLFWRLPGDPGVKSPLYNAGDAGSVPGWGTLILHVVEHNNYVLTTPESVPLLERPARCSRVPNAVAKAQLFPSKLCPFWSTNVNDVKGNYFIFSLQFNLHLLKPRTLNFMSNLWNTLCLDERDHRNYRILSYTLYCIDGSEWNLSVDGDEKNTITCICNICWVSFRSVIVLDSDLFFKIYFWLHWVFVALLRLSLAAVRGYSLLLCAGFSLWDHRL